VKKAYLRRTKSFHPDRFYRRADRQFREKVQEVFKQLNKGFSTISDAEKKREYDQTLGHEDTAAGPEEALESAAISSRARTVKGESPWKRIRVSKQKPVEERYRAPKRVTEEKKPSGPKLKLGLKDGANPMSPLLKKVMQIKKEHEQGAGQPLHEQAERLFKGAMMEIDRNHFNAAKINLRLAIQYAPHEKKYKETLKQLEEKEEKQRAVLEFKAGMDAQAEGDLKGAVRHFREALRLGYENAKLYHRLADLMMEVENNYEKGKALALKAIEMEPGVSDYHITLARAYKGMGQKAAAIIQLEKVLQMDPKNKLIAKELKALRKG
jgi:curved DNA-binding protein CbpA